MFTFEEFKRLNSQKYGNLWVSKWSEEEMKKNYAIAVQVEKNFYEKYGTERKPKLGDIVEYTDGYRVYKHASIVENLYYEDINTRICVCENGSSHTSTGKSFTTSGGAFHGMNKSDLHYVGKDVNIIWTWGCNGAGANQGINIPLKVNKWIMPYDNKAVKRSKVVFKQGGTVHITNSDEWTWYAHSFESRRAFDAWAKYVGYNYYMDGDVAYSPQKIVNKCWTESVPKPENGKPIKVLANARIHDGLVVTEELCITEWWGNVHRHVPKYGTYEYQMEMKEYWKYRENPMGV